MWKAPGLNKHCTTTAQTQQNPDVFSVSPKAGHSHGCRRRTMQHISKLAPWCCHPPLLHQPLWAAAGSDCLHTTLKWGRGVYLPVLALLIEHNVPQVAVFSHLVSFLWLCHTRCLYRSHFLCLFACGWTLRSLPSLGCWKMLSEHGSAWLSHRDLVTAVGDAGSQWSLSIVSPLCDCNDLNALLQDYWLVLSVLQPARSHPFLVSGGALPCPFSHCGCEDLVLSWSPLMTETTSAATDLYILRIGGSCIC